MSGRLIHNLDGTSVFQPYGKEGQAINSVSRGELNCKLMDLAEQHEVKILFNLKCKNIDWANNEVFLENEKNGGKENIKFDLLFGADGAFAATRLKHMLQHEKFDYQQYYIDCGYKELTIPAGNDGSFLLEKNALHIWPRKDYMLIALPNLDGSFTVTLFLSFSDSPGFDFLDSEEKAVSFFKNTFPDALEHMPELGKEFFDNPTSTLGTIKCFPWVGKSNALLMGDAAHAIVPFYGQGMNCALEDVAVLDEQIVKYDGDWSQIAYAFQYLRKPHADAIAELALQNYNEMRDHVDDPNFVKKRKLEMKLEARYEDYYSKYSLVTFHENVDYSYAKKLGEKQDAFLLKFCKKIENVDQVNLGELYKSLKEL